MKPFIMFFLVFICLVVVSSAQTGWEALNSGVTTRLNGVYFTDEQTGYVVGDNGVVIKTTDGGTTWIPVSPAGAPNLYGVYFFSEDSGLVVGQSGKMYRTTDGGSSWVAVSSGIFSTLRTVSFFGNNGICGAQDQGILYSHDAGRTWTVFQSGMMGGGFFGSCMVDTGTGFVGGENSIFQPIFGRTSNAGVNWNFSVFYLNGNEGRILSLKFIDSDTGFAACRLWNGGGAVARTHDAGANWNTTLFGVPMNGIDAIETDSTTRVFVVGEQGLIARSDNGGGMWLFQNSGVAQNLTAVCFMNPDTGFVVGDGGIILKTTTGGEPPNRLRANPSARIPHTTQLIGNYPNPFNPTTRIVYQLANRSQVRLEIFNITGQRVALLKDEVQIAGIHAVEWNAGTLPGGVYLCRLTVHPAEGHASSRYFLKMILLR